jgi:hypothetical protein
LAGEITSSTSASESLFLQFPQTGSIWPLSDKFSLFLVPQNSQTT